MLCISEGCIQLLPVLILNNYAVPVWDLHLTKDTNALEAVQRFACRVHIKRWDMTQKGSHELKENHVSTSMDDFTGDRQNMCGQAIQLK